MREAGRSGRLARLLLRPFARERVRKWVSGTLYSVGGAESALPTAHSMCLLMASRCLVEFCVVREIVHVDGSKTEKASRSWKEIARER